jgi:hypothetical protein
MIAKTGGCLCGQVRYSLSGEPLRSHLCHCRDCQHYTGTAFAAGMIFPTSSVAIQGDLKIFEGTGRSGKTVRRHFCPVCGSGVMVSGDVMPDRVVVQAGTLDDPAQFVPAAEIFTDSALPWVHSAGGFPSART